MLNDIKLPQVAVIIPYYNQADMIEGAILQHLNQTLPPSELIIVDDGSTDNGIQIIRSLQKKFPIIRIESLKKNKGVTHAINHGLNLIKSPYVKISACDDLIEASLLEKSAKLLTAYPQAAFSFSNPGEYYLHSSKRFEFPLMISKEPSYFSPEDLVILLRKRFFSFPSNACIFKVSALKEVGLFIPSLDLGADWFACFTMAFRYGTCFIPENLTWFCIRSNSYSAIGLNDRNRQLSTLKNISNLLLEPDYNDVFRHFKKAGIVYENSFRSLFFLVSARRYHSILSLNLFLRLCMRGLWGLIRELMPVETRQKIFMLRNLREIISGK